MEQTITLSMIIQMGVLIIGLWGFIKVVKEIVQNITARHDREQSWDDMVGSIQEERKTICERYDKKLEEMEQEIKKNHADTKAELLILTNSMEAVLDGLKQQGCNGKVSDAAEKLAQYMRDRAHE